jgi:putative methyltransferase
MGLPGETLNTFKKGLETALGDEDLGAILLYNCGLLPNAPMNYPEYREKYKLKSIRSPVFLQHSPKDDRGIQEYENILIETSSYTLDDLKQMYQFSWVIQTFHSFGILEHIAKYFHKTHGVSLMTFYETILEYCQIKNSLFSKEYELLEKHIDDGYSGKGWAHYDSDLGDISWPFEEASVARFLLLEDDVLHNEIKQFTQFLKNKVNCFLQPDILDDLIKFQVFLLTLRQYLDEIKSEEFLFDWKHYFVNDGVIKQNQKSYQYKNQITEPDPIKWTWEVVWFGHKEIKYKFNPAFLQEESMLLKNV